MTQSIPAHVLERLREHVRQDFASVESSHDIEHLRRVSEMAHHIAGHDGGDPTIAAAAGWVHDYHRLLERNGLGTRADDAADTIQDVLTDSGMDPQAIAAVQDCVAYTDQYAIAGDTLHAPSPEAAAVRDADNLDAIGAVGIARAFTYGAHLNEPIWTATTAFADTYDHGETSSILHHVHEKLLHLADEMQTPTGKRIATERHAFLEEFSTRLRTEWHPLVAEPDTTT